MLRSLGDRYQDYQSRTSRFFPLPPPKGWHWSAVALSASAQLADIIIATRSTALCSRSASAGAGSSDRRLFGYADGSEWGVSHYRLKGGC